MRTYKVLIKALAYSAAILTGMFHFSAVQAEETLFNVQVPLSDQDSQLTKQQRFDKALAEASRVELMRLTGRLDINEKDEFQELLNNPSDWLSSYSYQSIRQEGVVVGTKIEFLFDRKRIYQYFQKHNLIVWPYDKRPKTLVFGSQALGSNVIKLDYDGLGDNPTLDFREPAKRLGVPVVEPTNSFMWIYPQDEEDPDKIISLLSENQADFLMTYQQEVSVDGDNSFIWQLYDKQGQKVLDGQAVNTESMQNLKTVFARLLNFYSEPYRAQADVLGTVTLVLADINSADQLTAIENKLNGMKPMVHSARLHSLKDHSANFEIVYQGNYSDLVDTVQKFEHVIVTDNDAVIGLIQAKWVAEKPVDPVIPSEAAAQQQTQGQESVLQPSTKPQVIPWGVSKDPSQGLEISPMPDEPTESP
ncbi:MAG: DUF2066 domain-containing protein [Hydrogenovibrio sp.]|nr:DUF2066 domain-containing protein [Hydrogenovibrio sp.]